MIKSRSKLKGADHRFSPFFLILNLNIVKIMFNRIVKVAIIPALSGQSGKIFYFCMWKEKRKTVIIKLIIRYL